MNLFLRRTGLAATVLLCCIAAPLQAELKVGARAPDFKAKAWIGGKSFEFRLADALKRGPVVVYFFPAAYTSGCNREAHLFSEAINDFKAEKATVIGVTAGNIDQLAKFSADNTVCSGKFAVAGDPGAKIAKTYDALLALKPGWSSRTSYVIAPSGKVVFVHSEMSPDGHVKATLDALKKL